MEKPFGTVLREVRSKKGMGVRELARHAGIHPSYVTKVESLQVVMPEWDKVVALSCALESKLLLKFGHDALTDQLMQAFYALPGWSWEDREQRAATTAVQERVRKLSRELIQLLATGVVPADRNPRRTHRSTAEALTAGSAE